MRPSFPAFQPAKTLLAALFIALGVIMLQAANAPRNLLFINPDEMDAMVYPKVLLYIWLAGSALYAVLPSQDQPDWSGVRRCATGLLSTALAIAAYIFLFSRLGLAVSTFAFLLIFFWILGYRNPRKALPIALVLALLSWLVFEKFLGVTMPYPVWMSWFE